MEIYSDLEKLAMSWNIPVPNDEAQFMQMMYWSPHKILKYACSTSNYTLVDLNISQSSKVYKGGYHAAKHGDGELVTKILGMVHETYDYNRILEGAIKNGNRLLVDSIINTIQYDSDYATVVAHAYHKTYLIKKLNHSVDVVDEKYILDHNIFNAYYVNYLMIRRKLNLNQAVARTCIKYKLPLPVVAEPAPIIRYAVKKNNWKSLYQPHLLGHFLAAFLRYHKYDLFLELDDGISFTPDLYHSARLGSDKENVEVASSRYQLDWNVILDDAKENGSSRLVDLYESLM